MFKLSGCVSCHGKLLRWGILGFSSAPLLGAYLYNQGYKIRFLVCPIRHLTGIPCPTCGMTHSFMAIARGNFSQAVAENLFGPFVFAVFLIAAIHVSLELIMGRQISVFYRQMFLQKKFLLPLLFAVLSYHALRLYQLSQTGELYLAFIHSPLSQLFYTPNIN